MFTLRRLLTDVKDKDEREDRPGTAWVYKINCLDFLLDLSPKSPMKLLCPMFYSMHPGRCRRRIDTVWVVLVLRICHQVMMPFIEIHFSGRCNSVVTNIKSTASQIARIVRFVGCRCLIMSLNEIHLSCGRNSVVTNITSTDSRIFPMVRFVRCRCTIISYYQVSSWGPQDVLFLSTSRICPFQRIDKLYFRVASASLTYWRE